MNTEKYTTHGECRGQGPVRESRAEAMNDLHEDQDGCASQGGYSDRQLCRIDADGYLACPETGYYVTSSSGRGIRA